jgi:hypothetical protein
MSHDTHKNNTLAASSAITKIFENLSSDITRYDWKGYQDSLFMLALHLMMGSHVGEHYEKFKKGNL